MEFSPLSCPLYIHTVKGAAAVASIHCYFFISVINQLDAQNFCFKINLFHASTPIGVMIPEAV